MRVAVAALRYYVLLCLYMASSCFATPLTRDHSDLRSRHSLELAPRVILVQVPPLLTRYFHQQIYQMAPFDPVSHQQLVNRSNARCEILRTESKEALDRIDRLEEQITQNKERLEFFAKEEDERSQIRKDMKKAMNVKTMDYSRFMELVDRQNALEARQNALEARWWEHRDEVGFALLLLWGV